MPTNGETVRRVCGEDFDAVRVTADLAAPALAALGPCTGPVLANHTTRTWVFLVPPGSALPGRWTLGVRVMPRGTAIGIPPIGVTGGRDIHWAVPPGQGVTYADDLKRILTGPLPPTASAHRAGGQASATSPAAAPPRRPRALSPALLKVGSLFLTGHSDAEIAKELSRSVITVRTHLRQIGNLFNAPNQALKAAALLAGGHLQPPPVQMNAPDLAPVDVAVLRVLAGVSRDAELPVELRPTGTFLDYVDELRERCAARTDAHLIALAAAWGLLPTLSSFATAKDQP
ncbi:helix-turn-helix transcriptional regulator [Streptomyces virginiae]|uniref:helix-turn-helix transcriptional regulator n=1 Tax=Streptomyces virginiae TaxID=1961 RepID=UPI00366101D5